MKAAGIAAVAAAGFARSPPRASRAAVPLRSQQASLSGPRATPLNSGSGYPSARSQEDAESGCRGRKEKRGGGTPLPALTCRRLPSDVSCLLLCISSHLWVRSSEGSSWTPEEFAPLVFRKCEEKEPDDPSKTTIKQLWVPRLDYGLRLCKVPVISDTEVPNASAKVTASVHIYRYIGVRLQDLSGAVRKPGLKKDCIIYPLV